MKRQFQHPAPSERALSGPQYWRSLDELAATDRFAATTPDVVDAVLEGVGQFIRVHQRVGPMYQQQVEVIGLEAGEGFIEKDQSPGLAPEGRGPTVA